VRGTTGRSSAIISSLDFDCEQRLFASAGVLQRVSLYDYADVVSRPAGGDHAPARELTSRCKLSSLAFSPFCREKLMSCDYEGGVTLWDVGTGQAVREFEAHSKRIWSVACSRLEPGLFATASDDCRVKVRRGGGGEGGGLARRGRG
jgi:E3 ubiquitin-protein ligase RFWD2